MARRRRKRPKTAPVLVMRAREVCTPATKRTKAGRKRLVDCVAVAEGEVFTPHCTNDSCACGVSYENFRSGWTFAAAAEMVGARGKGGGERTFRPSRGKVLRMMRKLKRDEWEAHQRACKASSGAVVPAHTDEVYWASLPEDDFLAGTKKRKRKKSSKKKKKPSKEQASFGFENESFALQVQERPESWGKPTYAEGEQLQLLKGVRGKWSAVAPRKASERRKMPAGCFLKRTKDGKRLYPVCRSGTRGKVRVDCQGAQAAYNRARQQGDRRVAAKAKKLLRDRCTVS